MELPSVWHSHLSDETHKDKFKKDLSHVLASSVVERLVTLIKQEIKNREVNTDYDSSAWAYKQAHINGERQAYRNVLKLLGEKYD